MTPERYEQIGAIVHQALGLAEDERPALLDQACGDDRELRQEVESLLAHERMTSPLAGAPLLGGGFDLAQQIEPHLCATPADRIGAYRILSLIGTGGFGEVYLAEQTEPLRRQVALKIIKLGMDTRQVVARFEAERQALALMDHAHVAKVFDAGSTPAGRPYFVMELVRGLPITEHCDKQRLDIDERLRLFIKVCRAVHHAHERGLIHRDLKPSNVLVDGSGEPKVIDFGVAKAINQRLTEKTVFTELGQLIGTPEYMSPEQAEMSAQSIDERSDVYSLGVLLYELLTGALPLERDTLRREGFAEIQRIIREVEPPTPATRLSGLGEHAIEVAAHRRTDLRSLSGRLKGRLERIPVKALCKDRNDRYETAADLAADVDRYLHGLALDAEPVSLALFARGVMVRRPVWLAIAVVLALVLIVGVVAGRGWLRSSGSEHTDRTAARKSEPPPRADLAEPGGLDDETAEPSAGTPDVPEPNPHERIVEAASEAAANADPSRAALLLRELPDEQTAVSFWEALRIVPSIGIRHIELAGHAGPVYHVAYSPDGAHVATAADDETVKIWRTDGAGEPVVLSGPNARIAAWSPDGRRIATGSYQGFVTIRNADGSGETVVLKGPSGNIRHIAWSPDLESTRLVSTSSDGVARLWNADGSGDPIELPGHVDGAWRCAWSPDGSKIATGDAHGKILFWRADRPTTPISIDRGHDNGVTSIAWSPDGRHIVTTSVDGTVRIGPGSGSGSRTRLYSHRDAVLMAAWSPDSTRVITVSSDWTATISTLIDAGPFDESLAPVVLNGHQDTVTHATWSPDSRHVLTSSHDAVVLVWPGGTRVGVQNRSFGEYEVIRSIGGEPIPLDAHDAAVLADWHPEGTQIATACADGRVMLWDVSWPSMRERLGQATAGVLETEQRMRHLDETPDEAAGLSAAQRTHPEH